MQHPEILLDPTPFLHPSRNPDPLRPLLPLLTPIIGRCRYKEAVKAATAVLEQQPSSSAALKTRAKAYEQLGFFKQALADAMAVNKGDGASAESRELEARLREAVSANKAKLSTAAAPGAKADGRVPFPMTVTIKAALGDEVKTVQAPLMVTYAELLDLIKAKFPDAGVECVGGLWGCGHVGARGCGAGGVGGQGGGRGGGQGRACVAEDCGLGPAG